MKIHKDKIQLYFIPCLYIQQLIPLCVNSSKTNSSVVRTRKKITLALTRERFAGSIGTDT